LITVLNLKLSYRSSCLFVILYQVSKSVPW